MERWWPRRRSSGCGVEFVMDTERCESRSCAPTGPIGELKGGPVVEGGILSDGYMGTLARGRYSRFIDWRGADDDEGHCWCWCWCWCRRGWLEWLETDDAVLSLLEAPRRWWPWRDVLMSPERLSTLPISVDVRSIDWMPRGAEGMSSFPMLPSPACLFVMRETPDMLEARLVRPLTGPLGSLPFIMARLPA